RIKARMDLSRIGAPAVPHLRAALRDKRPEVRFEAAVGLSHMKDPARVQAVPDLVSTLQDNWWMVRLNALLALGSIGPPARDAVGAIQKVTLDEMFTLRGMAADTLVRIQGTDALPFLIEALHDARSRSGASDALVKLGLAAVPALRQLSGVRDPLLR